MDQSGISAGRRPRFRRPSFLRRAAARRDEVRPDKVLDAALHLFAAQGFAQTSVEAVARAAGLSKAAVYRYLAPKKALLAAMVGRAVAPVALARAEGDPWPVLSGLRRMAAAVPEIARVCRDDGLDRVLPALRQIIARGVAGGHLHHADPDLTVRNLIGPVLAHSGPAPVFGVRRVGGLELEALVENHLAILAAGVWA